MTTDDELLKWDAEHIVHALYPIGQNPGLMFKRAKGVTLEDHQGKHYLDFCSQLDCVNLGYGQEELAAAAAEAVKEISYVTTLFGQSHEPSIKCAMALAKLTPPGLDHFFFSSGGSESVEHAFIFARHYWHHSGQPAKYKIISQYGSYHSCTLAGRSCSNLSRSALDAGLQPVPGFIHVPNFYCYRCMFGLKYPECGIKCADFIGDTIEREGAHTVAAVIVEPLIGAGGMIPPPPEFWPRLREICTTLDVLLIADEVMTGFYRTGRAFAVDCWGIEPDLMTIAKGFTSAYFPASALAFNDRVYETMKGHLERGHTFGGHPVGMAVATKAMEIYQRERIGEHVTSVGEYIVDRLRREFLPLPCVGDLSGIGFMGALEIVADKESRRPFDRSLKTMERIKARAMEQGLYMRVSAIEEGMGDRAVWSPPLIMTKEEVDRCLDILYPILADVPVG